MSADTGTAEDGWRRLDKRMLLVHPVRELVKYIPVLLGVVIVGSQSDNPAWSLAAVAVIVVFALARWFTTTYRIGPDTVELRRGVLGRRTLTVPRSRIRSVDVRADVMHRLLGLVVLVIGTGQQADHDERFHLDGVDARQVPQLRALLLRHPEQARPAGHGEAGHDTPAVAAVPDSPALPLRARTELRTDTAGNSAAASAHSDEPAGATAVFRQHSRREALTRALAQDGAGAPDEGIEIGHWRPGWVRYAPLSLTGLAIVGPAIGLAAKLGVADALVRSSTVHDVGKHSAVFIALAVTISVVVLLVVSAIAACLHYLTTYFRFRVLDDGRALHIRGGLLTTRQTTLDLSRLRGATVQEPLLLRLAGGAELQAIMTGDGARQKLLPQAPRVAVERTLAHLLSHRTDRDLEPGRPPAARSVPEDRTEIAADADPASVPLMSHGPRARLRRYTRAAAPVLVVVAAAIAVSLAGQRVPAWIWAMVVLFALASAAVAHDRYRGLGHAVIASDGRRPVWLITRHGSLDRDRDCLEAPGVIGWTVRRTYFQRRAGVATVIAASAAGKKKYAIVDVPIDRAYEVIEQVTPGQLGTRSLGHSSPGNLATM